MIELWSGELVVQARPRIQPDRLFEIAANAVGEYGDFLRGAFTTASNGVAEFQVRPSRPRSC